MHGLEDKEDSWSVLAIIVYLAVSSKQTVLTGTTSLLSGAIVVQFLAKHHSASVTIHIGDVLDDHIN